jgi:uncharacterized protein YraI
VVVKVKWGDAIGGLAVRVAPDANAERTSVIPATGTGIGVTSCRGGWCQVKHNCASGWSSTAFLSLRTSELHKVTGVSPNDPQGLNVRSGPGFTFAIAGPSIPYNGTDVIVHNCQPSPNDQTNWCLVTYRNSSGWVAGRYLMR